MSSQIVLPNSFEFYTKDDENKEKNMFLQFKEDLMSFYDLYINFH